MDKSPDAFRTISEVADDLDVPQHVLRFWESKFHQIKPMKRGGGRRYYRPADVHLLRGIKKLLYGDGYTIKGVQKILREEGVSFVQDAWEHDTEIKAQPEKTEPVPASPAIADTPRSTGLNAGQFRILKAALFELTELRDLLNSAPEKPKQKTA